VRERCAVRLGAASARHGPAPRKDDVNNLRGACGPTGTGGDVVIFVLAAADHTLRLLHTWLAWPFAGLRRPPAAPDPTGAARQPPVDRP
jgi:hypothetical protein